MENLIYATVNIEGKEVMLTTPRHLREAVNKANGRDIFGSRFYMDVLNSAPYLSGPDFIFDKIMQEMYPKQYNEAMSYLIDTGVAKRESTFLLTDKGVLNILYVYKVDPNTLLLGGEKIPVKQNALFTNTPQTEVSSDAKKIAAQLFPSTEKKRQTRTEGKLTRLHQPGVSIRDEKSDRLINLSKPLMALMYKMPYIEQVYKSGSTTVNTDLTITEIDGTKFLGFKFSEDGAYPFVMRRDNSEDTVGIRNIFLEKNCPEVLYKRITRLLKRHKLLNQQFYQPEVTQDVIFFRIAGVE